MFWVFFYENVFCFVPPQTKQAKGQIQEGIGAL